MSTAFLQPVYFYNTLTRQKELFEPQNPREVKYYSCGPTVYNFIHIGNLRGGLVSDLLFRVLIQSGYEVKFVRNYTDIDDKIIDAAKTQSVDPLEHAERFIREVEHDYRMAGMLEPTHKVRVSSHIHDIETMVQELISTGYAYTAKDHSTYYRVTRFEGYGKLSGRKLEDLLEGVRVDPRESKENPGDFALWKFAEVNEMGWDSKTLGRGRPGWHIECSAMARAWLGPKIDIHHGGTDLQFPHHENEIAQSEAANRCAPYSKVWVHHAMLNFGNEKMSKSLGNVRSARDFLLKYGTDFTRFFFFSVHHRSVQEFSDESIENARKAYTRLYETKAKALEIRSKKLGLPDMVAEQAWGSFVAEFEEKKKSFIEHLQNDLHTPSAFAVIFEMIKSFNKVLTVPRAEATPSAVLAAEMIVRFFDETMDAWLGIGKQSPDKVLKSALPDGLDEAYIQKQIELRAAMKKEKKFAEADQIRKDLEAKGIVLKDTPQGTQWSYASLHGSNV